MGLTRTEGQRAAPVGFGQQWAERCLQCVGRDLTVDERNTMAADANEGLAPLERAIAGCLRGMRNII